MSKEDEIWHKTNCVMDFGVAINDKLDQLNPRKNHRGGSGAAERG